MRIVGIIVFSIILTINSFAQEQSVSVVETVTIDGKEYMLHQVKKGETIFSICKKYDIEQKELVGANPQLIFGLKEGEQLKVPLKNSIAKTNEVALPKKSDKGQFTYHLVKKGETIYSVAKQYNVSVESIYQFNPEAAKEVLENEVIRIPMFQVELSSPQIVREDDDFIYYKIQAQENLYSVARKFNKQASAIVKYNPDAADKFELGSIIRIPKKQEEAEQASVAQTGEFFMYTVESGDTYFSFERRYGVSKSTLLELNPALQDGLNAGLKIKIPSTNIQKIEVVPVQPELFTTYLVQKGETLYGIAKKLDVKVTDIKNLNPELKTRDLIAGETIYVLKNPVDSDTISSEELSDTIESLPIIDEENVNVSVPELIFKYEPSEAPACKIDDQASNSDTLEVAMFLPLYFNRNDTINLEPISEEEWRFLDSLKSVDPLILNQHFDVVVDSLTMKQDTILVDSLKVKDVRSLFRNSVPAINFYQGVLLALDSMKHAGANVRLKLYDTAHGLDSINKIISTPEFINTKLIVGPVDTVLQTVVSAFSAKNGIPLIAPYTTSTSSLRNNPFYYQVSPSKEYMLKKTAEYITDEFYDKNFLVITNDNYATVPEYGLVKMVREKFFSRRILNSNNTILFNQVDFSGSDGYWQVKRTLKKDVENVVFIPATESRSARQAILSRVINSLNVLAEEYSITLIGAFDYTTFGSINPAYYHKLKLHLLTPNYIDYDRPEVSQFIAKYRRAFSAEPELLSYRGYDVMLYFIKAFNAYGYDFRSCISSFELPTLQSDFNFQKVTQFGGFMNHTLFIMKYTPDFYIKNVSVMTEGRSIIK